MDKSASKRIHVTLPGDVYEFLASKAAPISVAEFLRADAIRAYQNRKVVAGQREVNRQTKEDKLNLHRTWVYRGINATARLTTPGSNTWKQVVENWRHEAETDERAAHGFDRRVEDLMKRRAKTYADAGVELPAWDSVI